MAIAPGIATTGEAYSQIIQGLLVVLHSQISTPARLIFVTRRDDIPSIPARRGRQPVTLVGGVGSNKKFGTTARRDALRGNAPARSNNARRKRRCPD
jgi:hypothetical protein